MRFHRARAGALSLVLACGGGHGGPGPDGGGDDAPDAAPGDFVLAALPVSSSKIQLRWTPAPGAVVDYQIARCTGASCDPTDAVATLATGELLDDGLAAGTLYRYAVTARDGGGAALARSNVAEATTRQPPGASPLALLADSLDPGQWGALPTDGIDLLVDGGADGNALGYTDDITFDPETERFYYFGSDHNALSIFAVFDAQTNAWSLLPRAAWMPTPSDYLSGTMHAYDHSAIDVEHRAFYHRPFYGAGPHRYDLDTGTWDDPPLAARPTTAPFGDYANCCDALEVFPELGGLVWVAGDGIAGQDNGHVYLHDTATDAWRVLAGDVDLAGTWTTGEYHPVAKVMIFYSAQTDRFYRLDAAGEVSPISDPPFTMYDGSSYVAVTKPDPSAGRFVVLSAGDRALYTYDVATDTWAPAASTDMPDLAQKPVVATPVAPYGVIFYTACRVAGGCQVYLYKPS